jgi:hypothetical protein
MSPHTIHGLFMDIQSRCGRGGTRIPEYGLAARTCHSDSDSESVGSGVLAGAGIIGDAIGITAR